MDGGAPRIGDFGDLTIKATGTFTARRSRVAYNRTGRRTGRLCFPRRYQAVQRNPPSRAVTLSVQYATASLLGFVAPLVSEDPSAGAAVVGATRQGPGMYGEVLSWFVSDDGEPPCEATMECQFWYPRRVLPWAPYYQATPHSQHVPTRFPGDWWTIDRGLIRSWRHAVRALRGMTLARVPLN